MKRNPLLCAFATLVATVLAWAPLHAELPETPVVIEEPAAEAEVQYAGAGVSMTPSEHGVLLQSAVQRLSGNAGPDGLWLESTGHQQPESHFRIMATSFGRHGEMGLSRQLDETGVIQLADEVVRFIRPFLTEEYSVSIEGVRQDFILEERPPGAGPLSVSLKVNGATVKEAAYGATLTLEHDDREISYRRLHVTDASGRVLEAKMAVESEDQIRLVVEDSGAAYPVRIDPTFSDGNWSSMGDALAGVSGRIEAMAADGSGNLFIAGDFSVVGNQSIESLAVWNGSNWSSVSSDLRGQPQALMVVGGDLYVAGYISVDTQNGPSIRGIARWDGNSWSGLGDGLDGGVNTILAVGSDIYAGGSFTEDGQGNPLEKIARWDGNNWSQLGNGINSGGYAEVRALAAIGSDVYVGGQFSSIDGVSMNNIAKWSSGSWSALVHTDPGVTYGFGESSVEALAVTGGNLVVGGRFDTAGATSAANLALWDTTGSTWTEIGGGVSETVLSLGVSGSDLYVGGRFYQVGGSVVVQGVALWDGALWNALGSGLEGSGQNANEILVSGSDVFVAGQFLSADGVAGTQNLAMWDGNSTWSSVGFASLSASGLNGRVTSVAVSGSDVYFGGEFTTANGATVNHVAKWDGSSWSALGTGLSGFGGYASVESLAVASNGDLYVGGNFSTAGGVSVSNIAKWDGTSWSALGNGVSGTPLGIATNGSDVFVTGYFASVDGFPGITANGLAVWNGTTWSALGAGIAGGGGQAIAVSSTTGDVFVGGQFSLVDGVPANHIAMWDGSVWSALGAGIDGDEVRALSLDANGHLWVGGRFQNAGGSEANNIARWDGASWNTITRPGEDGDEIGMDGDVLALQATGSDLYLGGRFHVRVPDAEGFGNLARWDGSQVSPLGSGVDGGVNAFGVIGSDPVSARTLHVGGEFGSAGGQISVFAASASLPPELPEIEVLAPGGAEIADGGSLDIGAAAVGFSTETTFTINNVGYADLTGLGVTIGGADAGEFSITSFPGAPLPSDGSTSFTVSFTPASLGAKAVTVQIGSNDADEDPFDINLSATGIVAPPIALVVDNAGDADDGDYSSGQQTLREAINRANIISDANTIGFDPSLNGSPILLGAALDVISQPVTITGNGAGNTVIDAQTNGRVFTIDDSDGGNQIAVVLAGMTLQNGLSSPGENGGGVLSRENLTISGCTITGNRAQGPGNQGSPFGGGVYAEGILLVEDSTISGNTSDSVGGGVLAVGVATLRNTTVSGNDALTGSGFGIAGLGGGSPSASLLNCTVVGNTASAAPFGATFGGVLSFGAALSMENCIVAGNVENGGPSDVFVNGPPISPGVNNMIGDPATSGGLVHGTDGNILGDGAGGLLSLASIVGSLGDNGGSTPTHLPSVGSPVINAGDNAAAAALSTDQRGDVRQQGGTVDIGAVETDTPGAPVNNDPTFSSYGVQTTKNQAVDLVDAKLLAKAADLDGDTLTITAVSATSAQGGSLLYAGGIVSYTPPTDVVGPDSFTITISDGNGGSVVGTIDVTINEVSTAPSGNQLSLTVQPGTGDVDLVFLGIPGVEYQIQRSFDLITWTTISTLTAAPNGTVSLTDPAPGGSAFYRTVYTAP